MSHHLLSQPTLGSKLVKETGSLYIYMITITSDGGVTIPVHGLRDRRNQHRTRTRSKPLIREDPAKARIETPEKTTRHLTLQSLGKIRLVHTHFISDVLLLMHKTTLF